MADAAVIETQDLACGYGDVKVLEDIEIQIREREVVTILGGSGSGKSTLLRTLVGLQPPLSGEVRLFDEPLLDEAGSPKPHLLRRIGLLFQQDALFGSMTVLDNVCLPLFEQTDLPTPVARALARAKLAQMNLDGFADRMPSDLSGGQRKRVGLARAVVLDPDIVFCDEPSSGLDPQVAAELDQTLLRLRDVLGLTVVAVTHELASVRTISDRAIMLVNGRVEAEGPIDELERESTDAVRAFFARESREDDTGRSTLEELNREEA